MHVHILIIYRKTYIFWNKWTHTLSKYIKSTHCTSFKTCLIVLNIKITLHNIFRFSFHSAFRSVIVLLFSNTPFFLRESVFFRHYMTKTDIFVFFLQTHSIFLKVALEVIFLRNELPPVTFLRGSLFLCTLANLSQISSHQLLLQRFIYSYKYLRPSFLILCNWNLVHFFKFKFIDQLFHL